MSAVSVRVDLVPLFDEVPAVLTPPGSDTPFSVERNSPAFQ